MSSDDRLERQLERWLAETARPMPPELLDDVLLELPRTTRRSWPPAGIRWRRLRPILGVGLAATIVVAVGLAGSLWPAVRHGLPAGAGAATPTAGRALAWDAAADFRLGSAAANPAPDSYGNPGVWSYLYGPSPAGDPTFDALMSLDTGLGRWHVAGLPTLEIYRLPGAPGVILHPFRTNNEGAKAAILGWTSPVDATVSIRAGFSLEQSCPATASGVTASVDVGSTVLWTAAIPFRGNRAFEGSVAVRRGDTVRVVVEPGVDSNCDTTTLELRLATR